MSESEHVQDVQPVEGRDAKTGQFVLGHTGRGGRPKGSRGKLSNDFIAALSADFDDHGAATIVKVRQRSPEVYIKVVANLIPAKLESTLTVNSVFANYNMTDPRDFAQAWEVARKMLYGEGPQIDVTIEPENEAEIAWKIDGDL
jgi:hypothetical protein